MTRIENVRETGFADSIIVEDHEGQKIEDIQRYGIDVFVLGSDWEGRFDYLKQYCEVVYLPRTAGISSTMLREGRHKIVRIGIIGTGRIAPRFRRNQAQEPLKRSTRCGLIRKDLMISFPKRMPSM